jgi:hypothetical protein
MGDGMISTIHILGFLMEVQEGRKGKGELIHSFSHLESLRESLEMRFEALGEASLGACFHGERHQAWSLVYLLRSFQC